jgi:cyd operon protein YbgT
MREYVNRYCHSRFTIPYSPFPQTGGLSMWYFSWILGLGLACAFAILNAMWFELHADEMARRKTGDEQAPPL